MSPFILFCLPQFYHIVVIHYQHLECVHQPQQPAIQMNNIPQAKFIHLIQDVNPVSYHLSVPDISQL